MDQLLAQTGRMCCLCRKRHRVQVHHIVPEAEGGTDDVDNGIPLCPNCHDEVHAGHSPGRTTRAYTAEELRLHRARTIEFAEKGGDWSPGTSVWEQDRQLILFYAQCLDRPAFRTYFHEELSFSDFDRAMEDTLLALDTGYWRMRDGSVIDRAKGKVQIVHLPWREKLDRIAALIGEIRQEFHRATGFDQMIGHRRVPRTAFELDTLMECRFRGDRSLGGLIDGKRTEAIRLLNSILEEIGHGPLPTIGQR
jgi:hypothetical protein